ncbi:MFS transporter [Seongchinamella sediminis]|uniref:MFS transporter n=1 Tax=Seongchinamella sediminis TaxID=2283635 RepID=UPI001EEFD0A2|nr:MFS transporter [Seongchinamella sediminis]
MLVGFLMGGWLNEFFGWRVAFMAVAIPGLLLAIILRFTVEEPRRGRTERVASDAHSEPPPPVGVVVRELMHKRTFRHLAMASALAAFAGYAALNWMPSFLARSHDMGTGAIGTWLALIAGFCGGLGTFLGGYLADRYGKRDVRWYAWVPGIAILLAAPLMVVTFSSGNSTLALLCYALPAGATAMYLGPVISVTHGLVSNRMRALASAIYFLILNLIGLGLGPLSVGIISDVLQPGLGQAEGLRYALLSVVPVAALWSSFHFLAASRAIRSELKID